MRRGSVKGITYLGNENGMANTAREFKYFIVLSNNSQKDNMKGTVKLKSVNVVFSFIDIYTGILVHWCNRIQIANNDHIHTLLPRN